MFAIQLLATYKRFYSPIGPSTEHRLYCVLCVLSNFLFTALLYLKNKQDMLRKCKLRQGAAVSPSDE